MERNLHLHEDKIDLQHNLTYYKSLVGKLVYITITRDNITFAVNMLSQFMHEPTQLHLDVALKLLRYMKGASRMRLLYRNNSCFTIQVYCDAKVCDWILCKHQHIPSFLEIQETNCHIQILKGGGIQVHDPCMHSMRSLLFVFFCVNLTFYTSQGHHVEVNNPYS